MIFKTITSSVDESRKTLALFNKDWNTYKTNWQKGFSQSGFTGGVKSLFQSSNSNPVISNDQVQILRNWNNAVKHGCTNQDTFNRIIANADENTKMYFAGLNKGKASMEGLKNAQNVAKTSTIGLTVAQTALNMAISMGLMAAISLAIKGFDKFVNSAKRASEAADEAFSETNDKVQEYDDELKSLDELIVKYKELKESGNLDLEGRKEIKEIQNDIADLVGTQAKNLDLVNGKLDDEIKKLDEISAKEAKRAYETATANYNISQKANESATGDDSFLFADGYAYTGKREKEAEKILKDAGFGRNVQSGGFFGNTLFVMDSFDNNMKELKGAQEKADYLQSMIDVLEQNGQRATDLYAGLIQQRDDYLTYLDNQQSAANSLVNSWLTYSQFSNEELSKINVDSVESFETYRQKMIDEAKKDESIGKVLADGTLSNEDLENTINNFMATSINFSNWYEQWINNVQSSTSSELFSSFDNTNLGERLQHANKLFQEGELTHKQYFDSLQNEIDNFDASNFTDSLEDANKASQKFFTDSVQQSASGLSDLINKFDAGEMSVSEYLDGYLAIGETLSTLADNLQENSSAWDKNGEAMSDAVSSGLDSVQSDLDNAMSIITGYKDSIYSLEQIMTGAVKAGSDEFTAHTNVIAQDLANIVSSGGEMASEVANTLGTTTSEIASNLTKNVSNQSLAAQAIAANTNIAISNMATSVANIFTTLGNAISNFNVDISFSKTSGSLIDAITGNGELKFNLSASGETLSTIGDAISAFGETLALNIQPQLIEAPDFSLDVDEYTPDVDTLKNYNDELDRLKNSSKGASKSTDALTESMKKQKEALESTKSELEKQKQYYEDVAEAIDWFYDKQIEKQEKAIDSLEKENELLEERIDYYDGALSAIDRYYEKQIEKLEEQKDALAGNNKEEEIALNLEKRRQELAEAKTRKNILQYESGKGFSYTTDTSAIKTAEENLVDAQRQKEEADIDAKIDKLKEYQALWAEIPSAKQKAEEESQMIEMLGANWESILLEGRIQNITSFKDQYIGLQQQIDNNESMIASYEEKIAYYESLKTEWDNLLAKYTEDTYTQLLIGAFGNDFENELLNGRTDRWTQFAEDYYNIQVQLKDVTDQIESLAKRMEEYASRIESAANSAVKAVNDLANVKIPSIPSVNKSSGSSSSNSISGNKYISSVKAKGGIITKEDRGDLDFVAKSLGEDHMVALTEGEAVIPKENVAKNPEAIDSLLSGQKLDLKALVNRDIVLQRATPLDTYSMFEKYKDWIIPDSLIMSRLNLPSQDFSKLGVVNNNQQQTVIQINGDLSFPNIKSGNDAELLLNDLSNMANKARQRSARR